MLTNRRSMLGSQPASPRPNPNNNRISMQSMVLPTSSSPPGGFPHSATSAHFPLSATSAHFPPSATRPSFAYDTNYSAPLLSPAPPGAGRFRPQPTILTTTTPSLPGYRIKKVLGAVHTSAALTPPKRNSNHSDSGNFFVRSSEKKESQSHAADIDIVTLLQSARDTAVERLEAEAVRRSGNALIGMGFSESEILGQVVCSAFATAVVVEKVDESDWIVEPEGEPPESAMRGLEVRE